jgi:hypothetical protein
VLCAFFVTLLMWSSQLRVLCMFKPRYLAELTLFSTCPWMVYLDSCGGFSLMWPVEPRTSLDWIASAKDLPTSVVCPDLVVWCAGLLPV